MATGTTVNVFRSRLANSVYGAPTDYEGLQFHFHSGSEHTIDGKRFDLEMHTVHQAREAANGFQYSAVGIIFSVEDYTADLTQAERNVIDAFFNGLKWDVETGEATSDLVLYGDLMEMVDSNKRWIYKGSVTTPPCATFVYWNVLSTIYPISREHLNLFIEKQLGQGDGGELKNYGNYREI